MVRRIAGSLSLLAFALCLVQGMLVENPFSTTLGRGLKALAVTFIVGMIVGTMAQRMLDENLSDAVKKSEINESKAPPRGR